MIRNRTHAIGVSKTDNSKRADLLDSSSADPLFAKLQLNCGHFLNALSVSLFPIPVFYTASDSSRFGMEQNVHFYKLDTISVSQLLVPGADQARANGVLSLHHQ